MYPLAPKLPPAHGHTGGCNIGRFPAHASKPVVRTAGVEPALGQLTEARNREKPNLLPCANIRIDCRFFRLSGCVGNPAPALSHIGLRGVAVPSCHILSFLNTSGFHGWVRPSSAPVCPGKSSVARFRFATVRRCRGHGSAGLFLARFFSQKSS